MPSARVVIKPLNPDDAEALADAIREEFPELTVTVKTKKEKP